jgi:hypothetical protein
MVALASSADAQSAQDVTTWHNDNNRTGWQQNETTLNTTNVATNFGLFWRYMPTQMGHVFAQPLAVGGLSGVPGCTAPCSLVFIADELDNLFAFNAASSSQTPVWTRNLASVASGYPVDCSTFGTFGPCVTGILGPKIGITGTPVIDTSATPPILYAVGAVYDGIRTANYELFAINVETGLPVASVVIAGTDSGLNPGPVSRCDTTSPIYGQVTFDSNHIQRSALLLIPGPSGTPSTVYIAFAPSGTEWENGWIFAYTLNGTHLTQGPTLVTTPHGTGGGIWGSGAGPASDGTYIYTATGNGTFDVDAPTDDFGDSLLKLNPSTLAPPSSSTAWYAPPDIVNYDSNLGRCIQDVDFGSGGVMAFPSAFTYNSLSPLVNADKESKLYVTDRNNLGGFNQNGGNNIETIQTPPVTASGQGYWASPAYWQVNNSGTYRYYLYYAVTMDTGNTPVAYQMYQYPLLTSGSSGPITTGTPTPTSFCPYSPTPSVSSKSAQGLGVWGSGILWAIEDAYNQPNCGVNNSGQKTSAVLHAYDAAGMNELYNSSGLQQNRLGLAVSFSTPTVFQGQVYIATNTNGTQGEVDVFGVCSPTCLP